MNIVEKLITEYKTRCINRKIEWIVVHYTGCLASAENVCKSMARPKKRKEDEPSSTNYIVDDKCVVHSVDEMEFYAWHCSVAGKKTYCKARNANSIGVDLCERKLSTKTRSAEDSDWYFTEETILNAGTLIAELMKKYNIDIDHVVRHYDVTHKRCPAPFVGDAVNQALCISGNRAWKAFKDEIMVKYNEIKEK